MMPPLILKGFINFTSDFNFPVSTPLSYTPLAPCRFTPFFKKWPYIGNQQALESRVICNAIKV